MAHEEKKLCKEQNSSNEVIPRSPHKAHKMLIILYSISMCNDIHIQLNKYDCSTKNINWPKHSLNNILCCEKKYMCFLCINSGCPYLLYKLYYNKKMHFSNKINNRMPLPL